MTAAKIFLRKPNCARNRHRAPPHASPAAKVGRACVQVRVGQGGFVRDLAEMDLGIVVNCIRPIIFGYAATGVGPPGLGSSAPRPQRI